MTTPTTTQECSVCGGDQPRDPEAWDEYLTDGGGYCPGHLAVDSTGRVVGCGAWDADVYALQDGPATTKIKTVAITESGEHGGTILYPGTYQIEMPADYDPALVTAVDILADDQLVVIEDA